MATPAERLDPEQAFEALYRAYVRDVYRYTLAVVRDPAEAEDLTQTTFLRAWRAFHDGVVPHTPHNWFLRIAHNVLRTHFRDRSRRPKHVELNHELEAAAPNGGPTAADVLDALAELPLSQREALVMRELEGRTYAEIAEIMGVSKSAVETLIFRARRTLRVRRPDLGRLASVPLPGSLGAFFRDRGADGLTALLGSAGAAKAVAVVAAGVVALGAGKEALDTLLPAGPVDARVGSALNARVPALARPAVALGRVHDRPAPPAPIAAPDAAPSAKSRSTMAPKASAPARAADSAPADSAPAAPAPGAAAAIHDEAPRQEPLAAAGGADEPVEAATVDTAAVAQQLPLDAPETSGVLPPAPEVALPPPDALEPALPPPPALPPAPALPPPPTLATPELTVESPLG